MFKKIVATIEARMNSSRLPGKVLTDIGGFTSLECQIRRLRRSKCIDEIILATTVNKSDDILEEFSFLQNCKIFRGSEEDVLSRILGAANLIGGDLQVQITGDCPLIDPRIVDLVIKTFIEEKSYDFVSNEVSRSYPIGLDCRVFPVSVLRKINKLCKDPIHRSHGSTYIYKGEGKKYFKIKNIKAPEALNNPDWRWTLDTAEDLEFLKKITSHFKERIIELSSEDLTDWLKENPQVLSINRGVKQKNWQEG